MPPIAPCWAKLVRATAAATPLIGVLIGLWGVPAGAVPSSLQQSHNRTQTCHATEGV